MWLGLAIAIGIVVIAAVWVAYGIALYYKIPREYRRPFVRRRNP